ncbi:MAG: response regulator [Thioalkalispiraceae bacterium]
MRLLLVEDDPLLGDGIRVGLSQEGYTVDWVTDGHTAIEAFSTEPYDLAVLDIGLPRCSGLEVLATVRNQGIDTPVLILTARDTIEERVKGLDLGADDYLTKPFDLNELSARIRALIRRSKGRASPTIIHDGIELDPASHTVSFHGKPVELSRTEFTVLQLLLSERGRVQSRARLEQSLYGWDKDIESNAIEVHIHHLRKKFGNDLIRTVRGIGYVIDKDEA